MSARPRSAHRHHRPAPTAAYIPPPHPSAYAPTSAYVSPSYASPYAPTSAYVNYPGIPYAHTSAPAAYASKNAFTSAPVHPYYLHRPAQTSAAPTIFSELYKNQPFQFRTENSENYLPDAGHNAAMAAIGMAAMTTVPYAYHHMFSKPDQV